nr:MAG TPA: hypothetical protein [Caudoviricetes sp.]
MSLCTDGRKMQYRLGFCLRGSQIVYASMKVLDVRW